MSFLSLYGYLGSGNLTETMDEFRLSNSSLAEAAPSVSAVPEPSSLVLAGMGSFLAIGCAWRRRRSVA